MEGARLLRNFKPNSKPPTKAEQLQAEREADFVPRLRHVSFIDDQAESHNLGAGLE